jgi:Cu(I)/Ag(I) efflux system membrane fusion protein
MKTNRTLIITGFITLVVGILIGWWIGGDSNTPQETHDHTAEVIQTEVWTCSMHPQIRQSEPGQCPLCGMDLIPASSESSEADPMAVKMSEAAMKLADVQTSLVGYGSDSKAVRLNGKVQPNEQRLRSQASHVAGRIEELFVDFTGEYIQEGERLATIYSPELVTAQKELIVAANIVEEQPALYASAKAKLKNWKFSDAQIEALAESEEADGTVNILANTSGYVLERRVKRGDYVKQGQSLYEVADLSTVWMLFDVYESDLQWVDKGDSVTIRVAALPDKQWRGKVGYVDPVIDPKTRVAQARVVIANPGQKLKPEMFATGIIQTQPSNREQEPLTVPKSAVMWTGERSVVYVKTQDANGVYFRMREVELGPELGERYVIRSGLEPGEKIATNGTFSIDAAAQLAGKPSMMSHEGGRVPKGHNHGSQPAYNPPTQGQSMDKLNNDDSHDNHSMNNKSKAPKAFSDLLGEYLKLKTALTKSDLENAQKYGSALNEQFDAIEMEDFTGISRSIWMDVEGSLRTSAESLAMAEDINELREAFKPLSSDLIKLAEVLGGFDAPLYVQYCPMADHNQGGFWISRQEDILNPYFGRSMLSCGSIKQTL